MSDLRCPECASSRVYCNGVNGPRHNHTCLACGCQLHSSFDDAIEAIEADLWVAATRMQSERDRCRTCPAWDGSDCGGCHLTEPCRDCRGTGYDDRLTDPDICGRCGGDGMEP